MPLHRRPERGWLLLAALVVAAAAFGLTQVVGSVGGPPGDRVSASEIRILQEGFAKSHGGPVPIDLSQPEERQALVKHLVLPQPEAARVVALIDEGRLAVGWITVWDNFDEDGDAVAITAGGFTQTIPLSHQPTTVAVPYLPGQPITIEGVRDGGGGITAAIGLASGPLPLPPLAVGQTVQVPFQ
jgi:hypothetical protein